MLNIAGSLGIGRFTYTMILPAMREGLGLHNTQMGLIGTIGFIGYLAMAIPGGAFRPPGGHCPGPAEHRCGHDAVRIRGIMGRRHTLNW